MGGGREGTAAGGGGGTWLWLWTSASIPCSGGLTASQGLQRRHAGQMWSEGETLRMDQVLGLAVEEQLRGHLQMLPHLPAPDPLGSWLKHPGQGGLCVQVSVSCSIC